ncbi:TetR/AcrR family transcriptional regulator C-terminal domain-containing protein [Actinomadura barringtoniae]|uniref:TetR/AcrR family transcriptional regulator C-terminal domain-containing protein n=1 Tax=Actinomadura barringtoniae TaxID=1427535 RepID=A0A939PF02_9ACTN|nr:TetR/AcrR family transcriptional regulator [Actinomadura barringtoniae]MBO2448908.1 TetR/AcrR family transcriptional regulator C-terminal domain-containing protein [Actinomadura barringtoniae]
MPRKSDPVADSVWMRPSKSRRGRPQLSREEIVSAAIELLDADGLDGLSMRRLGATIGAGATSLYFYVAHKDELLELCLDEVMGEIEIDDVPDHADHADQGEGGDWRASAAAFMRSYREVIVRHPWMLGLLGVRPAIGPKAMRMSDRLVHMLTSAGFEGMGVAHASSLLMSHVFGGATLQVASSSLIERTGGSAREVADTMEPYVERFGDEFPHYTKWFQSHRDLDPECYPEEAFRFGVARILDGLESWRAGASKQS